MALSNFNSVKATVALYAVDRCFLFKIIGDRSKLSKKNFLMSGTRFVAL